MITKTKYIFIIFILLILTLFIEVLIIRNQEHFDISKKREFVEITSMPDLAISTEALFIRNRSLTNIFSIYRDDPSLIEYFPSTFTYNIHLKE